jgi:geranylgeranyl reductase family protein
VTTEFDVAIVGGGPSGAAAAHYLATKGHSVLVCEKKSFPREKTCGDGLTPRAVKQLEAMGLASELTEWEHVQGLRIHAGGRTVELPWPDTEEWANYGLVKPRRELDKIVLDNAEKAGAKVLQKTQVVEPIFSEGVLTGFIAKRDGEDERIKARYIVCAEGAATKFATSVGRTRNPNYPMGWAIRQYFDSPMMAKSGWFEGFLEVKSGPDDLPGYGWVFPVGDGRVNVGVGLLTTYDHWESVNLNELQRNFVNQIPAEWGINYDTVCSKPRGGRLFMGQSVWPAHGPGFILVGDAAGMINPCNGEGIAYGYETGRIGARHIDEALRNGGGPALESYTHELEEVYGPYYRIGRRFSKLIGHPELMERLVSMGMRSKKAMKFALTIMANLEDDKRTTEQWGLRALKKIAELKP